MHSVSNHTTYIVQSPCCRDPQGVLDRNTSRRYSWFVGASWPIRHSLWTMLKTIPGSLICIEWMSGSGAMLAPRKRVMLAPRKRRTIQDIQEQAMLNHSLLTVWSPRRLLSGPKRRAKAQCCGFAFCCGRTAPAAGLLVC